MLYGCETWTGHSPKRIIEYLIRHDALNKTILEGKEKEVPGDRGRVMRSKEVMKEMTYQGFKSKAEYRDVANSPPTRALIEEEEEEVI